ncbi:MAG: segregation/condensation protein A [Clostridia bacterium]|nr:segregation/condensation protein A [Clostridia bacterium]MBR5427645.1 segregation/condensation protein A [Clostridia bacterium]
MERPQYKTEVFEGPLDLLLFLITKHKLNINDIPIFEIVEQYTAYVRRMQEENLDIASEFLEMAARLVYIKTVSLLPVQTEAEELKRELSGELIEYRDMKIAAKKLGENTGGFDMFTRDQSPFERDMTYTRLHEPGEILTAYISAAGRNFRRLPPPIESFRRIVASKIIAVGEKIDDIMTRIEKKGRLKFRTYILAAKSRSDLVARFLAVLELCKTRDVMIEGDGEDFDIVRRTAEDDPADDAGFEEEGTDIVSE